MVEFSFLTNFTIKWEQRFPCQHSGVTLTVEAALDAVPRQSHVLVLAVERLEEGHQVLVVRQLLGDGEGHDHHADLHVAFREGAEQRGDRIWQLLHGALRRGRRVAVVLGVTHP